MSGVDFFQNFLLTHFLKELDINLMCSNTWQANILTKAKSIFVHPSFNCICTQKVKIIQCLLWIIEYIPLVYIRLIIFDLPGGSDGKESACNAGDPRSIPGSGRHLRGNGNPLQYSHLENSMGRGVWWATIHEVTKSWTLLHYWATNTLQQYLCQRFSFP